MIVKTLELDIYIPESNSLKDKRRVVKSLISRCRQKFNVSMESIYKDVINNHIKKGLLKKILWIS